MPGDIAKEIDTLQQMTTIELDERYKQLLAQPVRTRHRVYLIRKVAWRIKANAEGDLSERAQRRAADLADDSQRESGEAFIASQKAESWEVNPERYDDGGFLGGTMERHALNRLLCDIEAGKVDCVVVYKVDRISRSLMDFSQIMETFEKAGVSIVSVTQQFNTTHSMERLTLNILLSFAQFEREIIGERIRDKVAAQKRKGKWTGGVPVLGYDVDRSAPSPRHAVNDRETRRTRAIPDPGPSNAGPTGRVPRISKLIALAIRFDSLLRDAHRVEPVRTGRADPCLPAADDADHEFDALGSGHSGGDPGEWDLRQLTTHVKWSLQRSQWRKLEWEYPRSQSDTMEHPEGVI